MKTKSFLLPKVFTAIFMVGSLASCVNVEVEETEEYRSAKNKSTSSDVNNFSNFSEIEANGASTVVLTQDSIFKVTVVGDKAATERIEITQSGSRLIIDEKSDWLDRLDAGKCEVHISLPKLVTFEMSGANSTKSTNTFTQNEALLLDMSGAGSINLSINAPKLSIDASGATSLVLNGKVTHFNVDMSGAGSINALQLESDSAKIESSGAGSVSIWANQYLFVDASGVGAVKYKGNPEVEKDISGMASVKQVN